MPTIEYIELNKSPFKKGIKMSTMKLPNDGVLIYIEPGGNRSRLELKANCNKKSIQTSI